MKNTLLFSTLIAGVALTGCNKSTRTSTAANDPAYTAPTATTADQAAANAQATADAVARDTTNAVDRAANNTANAVERAGDNIRSGVNSASNALSNAANNVAHTANMTQWRLNESDLSADLAANREIVRTKDVAGAPTGNMDKSTLQAAVEGRIKADPELSTFKIDVDPGANGEINLDGEVNNAAQVGKAIALALDTDGVTKVKSKIELDKKGQADRR
jgi:osmotically-inducible protein OsmY